MKTFSIAGSVDLYETLRELAMKRPVFHSEADFQHTLAWQVHLSDPDLEVHLEKPLDSKRRLDIEFVDHETELSTAIELKYLKAGGAPDLGRYDIVRDIVRIEYYLKDKPKGNGAVVVLTDDARLWTDNPSSTAKDLAFRVHDGAVLSGTRAWSTKPQGVGRLEAHVLEGEYLMRWDEYGIGAEPRLRQLLVEIP